MVACAYCERPLICEACQAEFKDFHHTVGGQHEVARPDIAVYHALCMCVVQTLRRLAGVFAGLGNWQRTVVFDQPRQRGWRRVDL